jgi:nitrogen-specific signal transduction histidine kinase
METNAENRELLQAAFGRSGTGARLEFVPSPGAAFEVMQRGDVDVLFFNQAQGGLDASEVMDGLRAIRRRAPVIMMAQKADEATMLAALRDGAFDCVAAETAAFDAYPLAAERSIARFEAARENSEQVRAILRGQQQWMSIIDAITDYIFVLDSDRFLVKVNNSFASAVGRHPRDIVGNKVNDVFDPGVPSEATLRAFLEDVSPRIYEKKLGDEIYQISIFPLQEENRVLTIHVMKNITEVRRLKDQLYHSDKLASIGLLVSGVAHEINNPLTGTIAYTELLAMKVTDEDVRAELKKILDSAERCKKIVDNLLTFSRQRTPSRSLESINDIIDRAIDLRSYWLKSNNIQIEREYDPVSTVFVDAQQIQQVVLNLLLNAEQAVVGSGRADPRIRFTTQSDRPNRKVLIQVADNGPGVPRKVAPKIFDPFFTTKPVGIGTGLGLSISHGIVTEHGGTIRFENSEGGGAVFTIELPTGTGSLPGAAGIKENRQVR